jgi:hypothetical protein
MWSYNNRRQDVIFAIKLLKAIESPTYNVTNLIISNRLTFNIFNL